ncbi:uncharacterized protein LOC118184218 isoform X2 [Stegodyphus dumicola]|uniref:uncharacterized protein LOC118184218 isoform X2 n=1 Tax=Stegodyphus dumicola TaxID=202533 RepID=UPI0015A8C7AC|nr:uncharacterized protein LOC118184218 isoform X2 [Stegodyphus dumicola]
MFSDLLFVVLGIFTCILIDNFNTFIALITCSFIVYYFSHVLSRNQFVVFLIAKIWGGIFYCYLIGKKMYTFFKYIFFSEKVSMRTSEHLNVQHCGEFANLETEINVIVSKISQYYIHSWYNKITDSEEFVSYLNTNIKESLLNLCYSISSIEKKRLSYVILELYLHFFSHFLDTKKKSEQFKLENFEMKHWAAKDILTEWCYLQSLVSTLLDCFGPAAYDNSFHSKCRPLLHAVVIEILTENVMFPLVNVLSDSSRLNSWILKLVTNYTEISGGSDVDELRLKDSALYSKEYANIKPEILLSSEDSSARRLSETSDEFITQDMLPVPFENQAVCDRGQIHYIDKEALNRKFSDRTQSDSFPCFVSSGKKSSSNINLVDNEFLNAAVLSCGDSPAVSSLSTIKRSRSADYIRQMPQLRALNVKDYNIVLQSENNKMLVALKSDSNSSNVNFSNIEQAEEAVEIEVPTLFTDVKITDTLQQSEAGLVPYTLYCIQYSGIFHDTGNSSETPQFVKHVVSIKRRFREFLALQSRLEDNPSLKSYLKGIKGPSKWLALPFSNLDKKNITERKSFLESYLKELCSQGPIAQSSELQEFLAYGGDARIAFAKKATDIGVPRIDKMLVRGVKGAIDMFRTALPNSPVDIICGEETGTPSMKSTFEDASPDHRFQEHLLDYSSREPEIKEHVRNYFKNFLENPSSESLHEAWKTEDIPRKSSLLRHTCSLKIEDSCQCSRLFTLNDDYYLKEENLFGNVIIEIVIETLKFNEMNYDRLFSLMKLCASYIDRTFNGRS